MAKNKIAKNQDIDVFDDVLDFDDMDSYDDEADMAGFMSNLLTVSNNQMQMALELTKLVVENNTSKNVTEEMVFSTFKKASKVINEDSTLKTLMQQLDMV